jgi:fatty acid desaturase
MANDIKLSEILSKDDLNQIRSKSNLRALTMLTINWLVVVGSFAIFIIWPNPLSFIIATLLIGGRQLGLGILVHECAHSAFFQDQKVNDFVGHWLCGSVVNTSVYAYREYHLRHHRHAGTEQDPDIIFVDKYPVERASLKRKIIRDVTGQTGYRDTLGKLKQFKWSQNHPWFISHLLMITVLTLVGAPWAYVLWWAAEIFVLPLLVRLRQIGEHGVADNRASRSPRLNTGTTLVSWWERLLIAPNYVNYHIEHHQFASVACYRLPSLHKKLKQGGYFDDYDCIAIGYSDVLRRAVQAA